MIALFTAMCVMFVLFAIAAARAGQLVVAVPAALLALWAGEMLRHQIRRRRRDRAS